MFLAIDQNRIPLTSKTDIIIKIERLSDRGYFDWSDNTFKVGSGVITMSQVLEEVSAVYSPGWYRLNTVTHVHGFNLAAITNAAEMDTYIITATQQPGIDVANLPQVGEIKVGKFVVENRSPVLW
jgi:hypothetical protein